MSEKYPSTAIPKKIAEDGAPLQEAEVEVVAGPVVRITPPAAPDVRAGTKPKPEGPTLDETYRA